MRMNERSGEKTMREPERTLRTEPIFQGRLISLQVDTVELPGGKTSTREIVRHPGAAAVIAIADDRLLVVEQYRKPLGRMQVEIPAGKLEPGEDPMETARRELEEETGWRAERLEPLYSFYTSPGFADEKVYLYAAYGLVPGNRAPDEDEHLNVDMITYEQAERYIREGRIGDAKTIIAVQAWRLLRLAGSLV
jgi:ADP-ribose pyrophosphatase